MNYSPPVSGQVAHITANHHVDNVLGNIGSMIANAFQIFCYSNKLKSRKHDGGIFHHVAQ